MPRLAPVPRFALVIPTIALLAVGPCPKESYIAPPPSVAVSALPAAPLSTMDIPITIPLAQVQQAAEGVIPRNLHVTCYNAQANGGADHGGVSYGYDVNRGALNIAGSGNSITLQTDVGYDLCAQARPVLGILVRGHCGPGDHPPPTAHIALTSTVATDPQWHLVTHTSGGATATGPCPVTFVGVNVAQRVIDAVNGALGNVFPQIDGQVAQAANLPARVQDVWNQMLAPVSLGNGAFLEIHPTALGVTPISLDNTAVHLGLHLEARPQVIVGSQPPADGTPLPAASPATPGNAFSVALPVDVSTQMLTDQLKQALKIGTGGMRYPPSGRFQLTTSDADVSVYGDRLVVRVALTGAANAVIYLIGKPRFDPVTNVLDVPDLDYTLETKNMLAKIANWAEGPRVLADLRQRLRMNLAPQAAQARQIATNALNRQVGPLQLTGTLQNLTLLGIYPNAAGGSARAYFTANGTVGVTMP